MLRPCIFLLVCVVLSSAQLDCNLPVGFEDGSLPDSAFSASSEVNRFHEASKGRLHNYKGKTSTSGTGAWCAKKNDDVINRYIEIDLGSVRDIGKIATQGRPNATSSQYVETYKVSYSEDGIIFQGIFLFNAEVEFVGNSDNNGIVEKDLPRTGHQPITGRYFRIQPVNFSGNICMRIELFECPAPTTQAPATTGAPATTQAPVTTAAPITAAPTTALACPDCSHSCVPTQEGYNCTCPAGYSLGMDGKTCEDVNECSGSNQCEQVCDNTPGSYTCSCNPGYSLQSDGKRCQDVNECSGSNQCEQVCDNTPGSYTCSCNSGYSLQSDGKSCQDINECTDGSHRCQHSCTNTDGSYTCSCNSGYTLRVDGKSCQDDNECTANTDDCQQGCTNTAGSFTCYCYQGYRIQSDGKSCQDIDECTEQKAECHPLSTQCVNKDGGYDCNCLSGYVSTSNPYACQDINECSGSNQCQISTTYCENTAGSYLCNCRSGYERDTDYTCKDINECNTNNGGCSDGCVNSVGSFTCTCPAGYQLDSSGRNCEDINECQTNNGGCDQNCHDTDGSFTCSCNSGYQLKPDKLGCEDIDECTAGTDKCDSTSTDCNNLTPMYECNCKDGFLPIVGNNYQCAPKTCPALIETSGTTVTPQTCLQNNAREVGQTCVFSCQAGYELPGNEDTLTCQPSGSWDASVISCQKRSCPALSAPANGNIYPDQCLTSGNVYQEQCHYSCVSGYNLNGVQSKTCGPDGQWDVQADPTCVLAHPAPYITCPDNVIVTLSPGANTADVSALIESPTSNQPSSAISVTPADLYASKMFPAGTTTLTYVATNPDGLTAQCTSSVLVIDNEAPKYSNCPSKIYVTTTGNDQVVTWDPPQFTDNVGVVSQTASKNSGDTFAAGSIQVYLRAKDARNNEAVCTFTVVVKQLRCVDPEPPANGALSCSDFGGSKFCSIVCDANKKKFQNIFFLSCDSNTLAWTSEVPDCVDYVDPDSDGNCASPYVKQEGLGGATPENICVKCPRGTFYDASLSACSKCPVGYISTTEGALQCQQCPANSGTDVEGSYECIAQCLPGEFSQSGFDLPANLQPCEPCPSNTYTDQIGSSDCQLCPNGTETLHGGATNVSACGGPPVVTQFAPNPTDAKENDGTQFECHGEGLPLPNFNVSKVIPRPVNFGNPVTQEYIQGSDGHLAGVRFVIPKVSEYDEGVYHCTVTNQFGSDTKYLRVNVELDFSIGKRRRR